MSTFSKSSGHGISVVSEIHRDYSSDDYNYLLHWTQRMKSARSRIITEHGRQVRTNRKGAIQFARKHGVSLPESPING